jgi:NADPH-dependent 2,4-dienoyl-CoA reductase/sulfur reductase-like enzyme
MQRIVVVGASLAGVTAAEQLRRSGFEGSLTLVGDERHAPYDRPPLSKGLLVGSTEPDALALRPREQLDALRLDMRLGVPAVGLDAAARELTLADGSTLAFDGLVIATGSSARTPDGWPPAAGLHRLRTLDDALELRKELAVAETVAVVGAGFVGAEVAAAARQLGRRVVLLEAAATPMARVFGPLVGRLFADLHRAHGVQVRCGVDVAGVEVADGRVHGVRVGDGELVAADVVLAAVGATPNVDWLDGSGLDVGDGVGCVADLRAAPAIYAAGDVARWPHPTYGELRVEHWQTAVEQGGAAAERLLSELRDPDVARPPFAAVPYVWSDQYDARIQLVGVVTPGDDVRAFREDGRLLVLFGREGRLVAALAWNWPRQLSLQRRSLLAGAAFADAVAAAPGVPVALDALAVPGPATSGVPVRGSLA